MIVHGTSQLTDCEFDMVAAAAAAAAAATTTASVHDIVRELVKFKKDSVENKNTKASFVFVDDQVKLLEFITAKNISRERLYLMAEQLRLAKTCSSRNKSGDRLGFGLSRRKHLMLKSLTPPKTLFYFHLNKANGLYSATPGNVAKLTKYNELRKLYREMSGETPECDNPSSPTTPIKWRQEDMKHLVKSRSQINPPTFRAIANELNTYYVRTGDINKPIRDFTSTDCVNKWHDMFPSQEDAYMTVDFLRRLKEKWPELQYYPKLDRGESTNKPPVLVALHIVFPWSKHMSEVLAKSIFCDGTYKVTVFNYTVVAITTLDGNKQHRPLQVSFILTTTAAQWCIVFDVFHKHNRDSNLEFYVVTSDKELAIRAGIRDSTMPDDWTIHFLCSIHIKWNVRDHKCSDGKNFGVAAAEMWSKLMQWADAEGSFNDGYEKMKNKFQNDPPR